MKEEARDAVAGHASARAAEFGRRTFGGLRTSSLAALVAVGAVVVLVSLPRLRDWALRENERDAVRFARHLAELAHALAENESPVNEADTPRAPEIAELLAQDKGPESGLSDADLLEAGTLLRRRGYLFDVIAGEADVCAVRAWPWEQGRTGLGAFVVVTDGASYGLANEDHRCSGPANPPEFDFGTAGTVEAGWQPLSLARTPVD